jgi:ABC transporter substrate binding protein
MDALSWRRLVARAADGGAPAAVRADPADGRALNLGTDDLDTKAPRVAFLDKLRGRGWSKGRNLRIDYRWGMGDTNRRGANAELVALAPEVMLAHGSSLMGSLQRVTQTIPIMFVSFADPIAGGFVDSLFRPGGKATGLTSSDCGMAVCSGHTP